MQLPNVQQTPALLQIIQWIIDPFAFMNACAQRYGDIFTVRLGKHFAPVVFVSNPEALQEILTSDSKQFDAPGDRI